MQIAPVGDANELSQALDSEDASVTVLLPAEEVLTQLVPLLSPDSGVTVEDVRVRIPADSFQFYRGACCVFGGLCSVSPCLL